MIAPPERSEARDAAILALLDNAAREGWGRAAGTAEAALLFPGGVGDLLEAYIDLADRRMAELAAPLLPGLGLTKRVRTLIAARLEWANPHLPAVRRAVRLLAMPGYAGVAARSAARTVDAIWHAAGDRSADFSWYTKRAILAGVYGSTLLYWLQAEGDMPATLAFLDRRLEGAGRIGKLRARFGSARQPAA